MCRKNFLDLSTKVCKIPHLPMSDVRERAYHYIYVIANPNTGKWYIGCTSNLRKRFSDHRHGKVFYTKGRGPFELIYSEACLNKEDAYAREKYLKTGMGRRYLKNRLKRFLSLTS